jgi:hypothetical protein
MRSVIVGLAALIAVGCGEDPADVSDNEQDEIQVAYFAELIEAEPWTQAAAYCISTGTWANRVDPSADVLAELRLLFGSSRVQPASACQSDLQGTTYNGELGRSYHIDSVTQAGESATVEGFYRQHALDAGGYRAQLQKQGTRWVVISFEMTWIA